jgi:hypothetical protein
MYRRLADALLAEAVTGSDARALITSAVAWWGGQAERSQVAPGAM